MIVDGVIDTARTRQYMGTDFSEGSRMDPDAIAQTYVALSEQPATAWTYEIDLRPSVERW